MLSIMKTAERATARQLRKEFGLPITEIARRIGVSKASVSLWVRDVELTTAQRAALLGRERSDSGKGSEHWRRRPDVSAGRA